MKIPKNLTEQEVVNTIQLIINRIAPKYSFYGYDVDDIKQEAFIICCDALNRYDENRPLENFLAVNLSNRLKNFVRDNNFTKSCESKKNVLSPKSLVFEDLVCDKYDESFHERSELFKIIDENLPVHMRSDYLKMKNGIYVSKRKRLEIIDEIRTILKDIEYEEGQDI